MNTVTQYLQDKRLIWRGSEQKSTTETCSSGYKEMDRELNGGFPEHGVVEIISQPGIGELRLLTPYIKEQGQKKLSVFINPPGYLCAEYLHQQGMDLNRILLVQPESDKEALWAAEQSLKSGCCGSVTLWHPSLEVHQARRLQVASETGHCLNFFFRTEQKASMTLPISLTLNLEAMERGIRVSASKRKGGWLKSSFFVDMSNHWPQLVKPIEKPGIIPFPLRQRGRA